MNILEAHNLCKSYKTFNLNSLNFSIPEGKIVGFVGENGSGKSTTMKIIAGLVKANSGEVKFYNKDIDKLNEIEKSEIAFILDELCFPENYKIKELVKILCDIFDNLDKEKLLKQINDFKLPLDKKIKELSKGMKAKLNISVMLAKKSKFLVLDEPTNGLDPFTRDEFLDILLNENLNNGTTILISSHIISDLERICNEFIFIHNGSIILNDSKENIYNNYKVIKIKNFDSNNKIKGIYRYKKISSDEYELLVDKDCELINEENIVNSNIEKILVLFVRGNKLCY